MTDLKPLWSDTHNAVGLYLDDHGTLDIIWNLLEDIRYLKKDRAEMRKKMTNWSGFSPKVMGKSHPHKSKCDCTKHRYENEN